MGVWEERDGLLVTSDPATIQAEIAALFKVSPEERAYLDSIQVYCDREGEPYCWDYGTHVDLGPGIWLSRLDHDYSVNATETAPLWHTFRSAPDEETARDWATRANLGTGDPDQEDETPLPQ